MLRSDVTKRLMPATSEVGHHSTRVAELGLVLGDRLPTALVVLAGAPGAGKTTLSQQICFANATPDEQGEAGGLESVVAESCESAFGSRPSIVVIDARSSAAMCANASLKGLPLFGRTVDARPIIGIWRPGA